MRATILVVAAACLIAAGLFSVTVAGAEPASPTAASSSEITSRIQQTQVDIEKLRSEVAVLDLRISTERQIQEKNRTELADANSSLIDAEDRYNATRKLYESRLTAIYKLGEERLLAMTLDTENLSEALSRVQYLSTISENDRKLVERVRAEESAVRQLHDRIDELKQSKAGDIRALNDQKEALTSRINSGQSQISSDTAVLAQRQSREQDEETRRLAQASQDAGLPDVSGSGGPIVVNGQNQPPAGLRPTGIIISGVSSWYGPGFNGNRTANGEIYNMYAFTAAHKTLPFGTWLKVSYRGRSVFVRINDRGPYVGARVLDLSFASAQSIGLGGIGYVTCEIYR